MTAFELKCIEFILSIESGNDPDGGYNNLPTDPGGETKWGISKRAYPGEDILNLQRSRAIEIYHSDYWLASNCENYPNDVAVHIFDQAVNGGVGSSKLILRQTQEILVGKILMDVSHISSLIYADFRKRRYCEIARNKSQLANLRGWLHRVDKITDEIRKGTFS